MSRQPSKRSKRISKHTAVSKRPQGRPRGMGPIKHKFLVSLQPKYEKYKEEGKSGLFYDLALAMWLEQFKDTGDWGTDPLVEPPPIPEDLKITPITKKQSRKAQKTERKLHAVIRRVH